MQDGDLLAGITLPEASGTLNQKFLPKSYLIVTTPGAKIGGIPFLVESVSSPYVLVTDIEGEIHLIDARTHALTATTPHYAKRFKRLYNERLKKAALVKMAGTLVARATEMATAPTDPTKGPPERRKLPPPPAPPPTKRR